MLTLLLAILGFQLTPPPVVAPPEHRTEIVEAYAEKEESSDYVNRRNEVIGGETIENNGNNDAEQNRENGEFSPSDGIKPMPPREDDRNFEVDGERENGSNFEVVGERGNGSIMPLPLIDGSGKVDSGRLADRKRALDERFSRMFELQSSLSSRMLELQSDSEEYSLLKRAYSRELRRIIDEWIREAQ